MGSWGVAVFADDMALDIRGEWRKALLRREDPGAVSRRMVARLGGGVDAHDVTEWIALAAAQYETGHLQDDVRDRALELIAAGAGLDLWEDAGQLEGRQAVLRRLADKLRGPQPKPKRLRGPRRVDPGVEVGDVLRVHDEDRRLSVLFLVIDMSHQVPTQPQPLVLGLYAEPDGPYLSDLDFSAFRGEEPPANQGVAQPAMARVITSRDRIGDVGEIVARCVHRAPGLNRGGGSMTSWSGLRAAYCNERTLRILRRVTEQRLERYGPSDDAWRIERDARVAEYEERLGQGGTAFELWRRFLPDE
jgi:hypothetical protein